MECPSNWCAPILGSSREAANGASAVVRGHERVRGVGLNWDGEAGYVCVLDFHGEARTLALRSAV